MHYDVTLRIGYEYDYDVDASRHIVRLMPADLPGEQRLIAGSLDIEPRPDEWISRRDFFGNGCIDAAFLRAHRQIEFAMYARVERQEAVWPLDVSPRLSDMPTELQGHLSLDAAAPHHFIGRSSRVSLHEATTSYARTLAADDMQVLSAVRAIGEALHRDMTYDPDATTVDTPLLEAFEARRGVCQDFSHIMIACLRGLGIPAGYVSGFLRTIAPPGKARLEGADAMHAWVRAWCGSEIGWIEYDPTNGMVAGVDHIVVARGRDYSDIAPVKGVMRTYGEHASTHAVDVVPVAQQRDASTDTSNSG